MRRGGLTRSTTQIIGEGLGYVTTQIEYLLEPDVEGREEALASLGDAAGRFEVLF